METLLKIGGVLAVLVVPIILSFLNNRLAHLKHTQESKTEALKLANDFEEIGLEDRSALYKDRLAKSLFNNDVITYHEAKFFSKYENADYWVKEYIKIRGMLKLDRDDDGTVTGIKRKSHWIYFIFNFIGYCACVSIGLIPFVIMNKYIQIMTEFYGKGMPLVIFLLIAIPALFLVVGYLCLRYTEKYASCGIFLHDFHEVAFKIMKKATEINNSEVDAAA